MSHKRLRPVPGNIERVLVVLNDIPKPVGEDVLMWSWDPVLFEIFRALLPREEVCRIRICRRCADLFWAGRFDKICCSKPCAHAYRQFRYRYRKQRAVSAESARKDKP